MPKSATLRERKACIMSIATGPRGRLATSTHSISWSLLTTLSLRFVGETAHWTEAFPPPELRGRTLTNCTTLASLSSLLVVLPLPKLRPRMRSFTWPVARKHGAVLGKIALVAVTPPLRTSATHVSKGTDLQPSMREPPVTRARSLGHPVVTFVAVSSAESAGDDAADRAVEPEAVADAVIDAWADALALTVVVAFDALALTVVVAFALAP